ncbi:MAG: hypothetical protein AABZ30_14050 [Myxococcota bacterium]
MVRLAITTALFASGASAATHDLSGGLDLTAAARVGVLYDDNALLGRRGQFLDAPGAPRGREDDVAAVQAVELDLGRRLRRSSRVTLGSRFELAQLRQTDELAGYDVATSLGLEQRFGPGVELAPVFGLLYHREEPQWSHRTLEPGLRARYTFPSGLMAELRYRFTRQDFARAADGTAEPKNSYANVDFRGHRAEIDLRQWFLHWLRLNIASDFQAAEYAGNLNTNLADYAGLDAGTERKDVGAGATGAVAIVPWAPLLFSVGSRYEVNRSNSDAFTFGAIHGLASALWTLHRGHALYADLDYGRYAFPDEQFDRRFTNTRLDWRRDVSAVYRFEPIEPLRAEVAIRRIDSVSNDCAAFDPRRDAFGLPVYSRSYSCYGRTRVEASVRWEF